MITTHRTTLVLLLLSILLSVTLSQNRQAMRFNADEAVILREVAVVVTLNKEDNSLRVMPLPVPADGIADLKEGDEVGMANGKRVKTIKDLRDAYDGTKPGAEFKLGIRRDGRAQIVTFERKEGDQIGAGGGGRMIMRTAPEGDDADVFPALGFGIVTNEGKTTVNMMLPNAPKNVAEGDEVVSINGKKVSTSADFSRELDATKIGDDLSMVFRHDGKQYTLKMKRPEPPKGMMRIERN